MEGGNAGKLNIIWIKIKLIEGIWTEPAFNCSCKAGGGELHY